MNGEPTDRTETEASNDCILVVGASSDLGLQIIRSISAPRTVILAHCHQSLSRLESLRHELPHSNIVPIQADLSSPAGIDELLGKIQDHHPSPTKIVHIAAPKLEYLRFKDVSWEDFQRGLDIQLRSLVFILRKCLPPMALRRRGKVVVILSSVTFNIPPAALSHYVTTKYALLGLVRALAAEYSSMHVNINAVSPSMIETRFLDKIPPRMVEILKSQSPWQRAATSVEVAGAVRFLLSEEADYLTGVNLPISGGSAF